MPTTYQSFTKSVILVTVKMFSAENFSPIQKCTVLTKSQFNDFQTFSILMYYKFSTAKTA